MTPSALSCSATLLPASTDLLVRTTRDPAVARAFTVSTPSPLLPPVTKDVLPVTYTVIKIAVGLYDTSCPNEGHILDSFQLIHLSALTIDERLAAHHISIRMHIVISCKLRLSF